MKHETMRRKVIGNESGSVLIAVLAIIGLLAFLTTKFIDDSINDLEYQALFKQPADFRSLAYNSLEISLAVLYEIALIDQGKLHHPKQGWGSPLTYFNKERKGPWEISIAITDPTGKIPFNALSEDEMLDLLEEGLDIDFSTAVELKDVWIDWIDNDESRSLNGAESEDYENEEPPYRSPNRTLQSFEELKLMKLWKETFFDETGKENELYAKLINLVSLTHNEPVNINAASSEVLEYLLKNTSWDAESLFDLEDKPYLTKLPETLESQLLSTETNVLKIVVSLKRGAVPFTLNVLVEKNFTESPSKSNLPGKTTDEDELLLKIGTKEEQLEIKFPFSILNISESTEIEEKHETININSNLDIFD
tara:strand:- start:1820 stop:2914 length:1095 start_codon:yes stop_codon:yes gene_type:complete